MKPIKRSTLRELARLVRVRKQDDNAEAMDEITARAPSVRTR